MCLVCTQRGEGENVQSENHLSSRHVWGLSVLTMTTLVMGAFSGRDSGMPAGTCMRLKEVQQVGLGLTRLASSVMKSSGEMQPKVAPARMVTRLSPTRSI